MSLLDTSTEGTASKPKKIVYFAPICEWNDFVGFNCHLLQLKKKENISEIVVVIPDKAKALITEATRFITIPEESIDKNDTYPAVLEIPEMGRNLVLGPHRLLIHGRNRTNLYEMAYEYVTNSELYKDHTIIFFEEEMNLYGENNMVIYRKLHNGLSDMILDNIRIKPTQKVYEEIKEKYKSSFDNDKKNYLLLTRNFKNKAPAGNTINHIPKLEYILNDITKNNVKIINIGFPAQNYSIDNENYEELDCPIMSQEELVALMYCSHGVILSGYSGGFVGHVLSNVDIFLAYHEWSALRKEINLGVFPIRAATNTDVSSIDLSELFISGDSNAIYDILKNHEKKSTNTFSDEKQTTYLLNK